jgi:hypothetical protein
MHAASFVRDGVEESADLAALLLEADAPPEGAVGIVEQCLNIPRALIAPPTAARIVEAPKPSRLPLDSG